MPASATLPNTAVKKLLLAAALLLALPVGGAEGSLGSPVGGAAARLHLQLPPVFMLWSVQLPPHT